MTGEQDVRKSIEAVNGLDFRQLVEFVRESNRIEGILTASTEEVTEHQRFVTRPVLTIGIVSKLVGVLQPNAKLRDKVGLDVRVGRHTPPPGGPHIVQVLGMMLDSANDLKREAYDVHCEYETLHPFTDGNGRSGRAIWLWMMLRQQTGYRLQRLFLHEFYYQTLAHTGR